jgi:cytochrome bd-type quinol oxidase subunit 1
MKTSTKVYFWLPRIVAILAILFISLFALDSFNTELTPGKQLLGFAMHLIPSIILLIILIVAWKWEIIGGIIFILIGVGLSPYVFSKNFLMNNSVWMSVIVIIGITIPFIVVGILFIISYFKRKKELKNAKTDSEKTTLNSNQ